ncbi:unnamed protein product [Danaus chrysippus]|uniref:(African queen) hypothetical protein n=1 Tax=Danaus chrysippus TaxID=151541 RepID=A0A8J2QHG9_9NEOP|nr:unnamed protein product [Danaus chrysippus]
MESRQRLNQDEIATILENDDDYSPLDSDSEEEDRVVEDDVWSDNEDAMVDFVEDTSRQEDPDNNIASRESPNLEIFRYVKIAAQLLLDDTDSPELVTGQEIEILKQLIPLLQPLEFVTRESSGQNYVTLSKIIPMINCLTSQLTKFSSSIECVTQLQKKLLSECKKRFGLIEFNTLAALATILDPRFKNLHFQDANACGRAIQKLKNIIKEDITISTSGSEDEIAEDFDFWSHHKQLAVGQKRRRASTKADEVSIYLANPVCALKANPLEEWEDLKPVFPALYKQARIYLNVVSTSVPCERLFSKAGATVTVSRNRLTGKHLEKFIFLGSTTKTDFFS